MLRKIRIILAAVFFTGITMLFLDFTGTLHTWLGWMAKIQFLPAALADDENVSTLSGALNFMTYVGSAASTYGFALLSENFGWGGTVASWLAITVLGTMACVVCNLATKKIKL